MITDRPTHATAPPPAPPRRTGRVVALDVLWAWVRAATRWAQRWPRQRPPPSTDPFSLFRHIGGIGLMVADDRGRLVHMNPTAAALTGIPVEHVGQTALFDSDISPQPDLNTALQDTLRTGQVHTVPWYGPNASGQPIDADLTVSPLEHKGQAFALIELVDRTASRAHAAQHAVTLKDNLAKTVALDKALLDAKAGKVAKQQFWATLSHEIRTPMNGMMGMLQVLAMNPSLSPSAQTQLDMAIKNAQLLLALYNDVFDQEALRAGRFLLTMAPMRPYASLNYLRLITSKLPINPNVRVVIDVDQGLTRWVLGDEVRLRQVLLHLLTNAVKFTHHGMVRVTGEVTETTAHHQTLLIQVQDTGIGMTDDLLAKVFTPFVQGDMSDSRGYGGRGLGLVICKGLVAQMGGQLTLQSTLGMGTTATLSLTLPVADDHEPAPSSGQRGGPQTNTHLVAMQHVLIQEARLKADEAQRATPQ